MGKQIDGLSPNHVIVRLNPREARLFKLIKRAKWDNANRSYWKLLGTRKYDKSKVFKYLEEELPKYVLKAKLDQQ